MATSSALNLIVDITNPGKAGIIQSFLNRLPASVPLLVRNDVETASLRFVQPSAGTARPWDDVDYSTATTILGLGEFDAVPTTGTNTLQFGPKTVGNTNSNTTVNITGSTAGIVNGMLVAGTGITTGTTATISGSTVILSIAASTSVAGAALYFYNETAGVAAGASAAVVSTAVNALASVIAAGGVTITNPEPGAYLAALTASGVTPGYFSGNPIGLNPSSSLVVSEVVVGAIGVASQQLIEIFLNPYALNSTWTTFPAASGSFATIAAGSTATPTGSITSASASIVSVSSLTGVSVGNSIAGAGIPAGTTVLSASGSTIVMSQPATATATSVTLIITSPNVQVLTLTSGSYDGSFQISTPLLTTVAIAMPLTGTTAQSVQTALNALGAAYTVTGNAGGPFTISIAGTASAYTANVTGLIVPLGLTGTLNLSTYSILQKFISSGMTELTLDLELQVTPSGGGQSTPLQLTVLVNKNVINLSTLLPAPLPLGITAAQVQAIIAALFGALSESVSAAGSTTPVIPLYCKLMTYQLTTGAGSGPYIYNELLTSTNRQSGDKFCLALSLPASTNPTINVKNNAGSTIFTAVGTGSAVAIQRWFTFKTDWTLDS